MNNVFTLASSGTNMSKPTIVFIVIAIIVGLGSNLGWW
ncbi:hypothetical protein NAL19_4439 [Pectobacterium sp. F1-1]|nr:hypothetical protein NAL19_4439 [Pectobacterium sp. F1-1]